MKLYTILDPMSFAPIYIVRDEEDNVIIQLEYKTISRAMKCVKISAIVDEDRMWETIKNVNNPQGLKTLNDAIDLIRNTYKTKES